MTHRHPRLSRADRTLGAARDLLQQSLNEEAVWTPLQRRLVAEAISKLSDASFCRKAEKEPKP